MLTGVGSSVEWDYDKEQDVLYLGFGDASPSYVEEDPEVEGLNIRRAMADGHITGAVIVWYSLQDRQVLDRKLPFTFDFSLVRPVKRRGR